MIRMAMWTGLALILAAPLVAMRFTDAVVWTGHDFAMATLVLGGTGIGIELARHIRAPGWRVAAGLAVLAVALAIWADGAVGIA